VNRLSTRKKDSKTNRRDAPNAEKPERTREEATMAALTQETDLPTEITEAADSKRRREPQGSLFLFVALLAIVRS
jgi:hypothetical protein